MDSKLHIKSLLIPAVLSGVLLLSGAGVMYYYYLYKDDDEPKTQSSSSSGGGGGGGNAAVSVQIPKEAIGLVIGRQGSNIKLIQQSTNTTINFTNKEKDGVRECVIKGAPDSIKSAEQLVIKVINNQPILDTEELEVPNMAVSRILGKNGNTLRSISLSTGAKITVGKDDQQQQDLNNSSIEGGGLMTRKVFISGTKEQIQAAKTQLLEKVVEEKRYREALSASVANMSLRSRGKQSTQDKEEISIDERFASLGCDNKVMEAYVSAVDSATHFWIQVVGPRSIELDKLLTAMTEYYSDQENRELHQLEEACVDSIVAAKFPHDDYWYRAKVCVCAASSDRTPESQVTVYYVDFGDTETVSLDDVCELRTDFLRLSFQAIECYLANIDPESARSDDAADVFEELTHASQWKPVRVEVLGYKEQEPTTTTTTTTTTTAATITPYVQITNISGPVDFDVGQELVKRGLASFCNNSVESEC